MAAVAFKFVPRSAHTVFAAVGLLAVSACGDDDPIPPAQNQNPVAVATATPDIVPRADSNSTVVTLDGSGSSDPDGDALTFMWTVTGATFEAGTSATDVMAQVSFPGDMAYDAVLDVSDGNGGTAQATVNVGVVNGAPTAVVTADPDSVATGDGNTTIVTIDATGSSDPDGDSLVYAWTVPSGTFENGTTDSDDVIEVSFPGSAPYEVTVIVTDAFSAADTAAVTIRVF